MTRCAGADYGVNSDYGAIGLDLDVLKRIDFGIYKGVQFAGTQILTFAEWLILCKKLGMEVYIDTKINYTDEILTAAATIVMNCGMAPYATWLNVYITHIATLRALIPDARVGILYYPTEQRCRDYAPYNTGRGFFFNGNAKSGMTAEAIQLGLSNGFEVEVWYVDYDPSDTEEDIFAVINQAISYGVTGLTLYHYRADEAFGDIYE